MGTIIICTEDISLGDEMAVEEAVKKAVGDMHDVAVEQALPAMICPFCSESIR